MLAVQVAPQSLFASLCLFYWLFLEPALSLSPVGHFVGHLLWVLWNGMGAVVYMATYK